MQDVCTDVYANVMEEFAMQVLTELDRYWKPGSSPSEELPLDIAQRRSKDEDNCFIFDKDGDENHVTFLVKNSEIL